MGTPTGSARCGARPRGPEEMLLHCGSLSSLKGVSCAIPRRPSLPVSLSCRGHRPGPTPGSGLQGALAGSGFAPHRKALGRPVGPSAGELQPSHWAGGQSLSHQRLGHETWLPCLTPASTAPRPPAQHFLREDLLCWFVMLCSLFLTNKATGGTLGQMQMDSGPVLPPPTAALLLREAASPCCALGTRSPPPQANTVHWMPGRLPRLPHGQGASLPTGNPLSLLRPGPVRTPELQPVGPGTLSPPLWQGLPSPDGRTSRGPAHGRKAFRMCVRSEERALLV